MLLLMNTKLLIMIMKKLLFFFNDLANDKKKKYLTMDIDKFVQQILIHLPPKILRWLIDLIFMDAISQQG